MCIVGVGCAVHLDVEQVAVEVVGVIRRHAARRFAHQLIVEVVGGYSDRLLYPSAYLIKLTQPYTNFPQFFQLILHGNKIFHE